MSSSSTAATREANEVKNKFAVVTFRLGETCWWWNAVLARQKGKGEMRVFIAGATGVLGRPMVRQLTERNHHVVGLARDEKGKQTIRRLGGEAVVADIFEADSLATAVKQVDVVIHAATAIPAGASNGSGDWALNDRLRREGTRALTEAAVKLGAKTYLQQSVFRVGRPADDWYFDEQTKVVRPDELYRSAFDGQQIAPEAGEKYGFNVSLLRCGGFYAPDARHRRTFARGLLKRRLPLIGGGEAVSANLHADDAASALVAAAEAGKRGLWHITDEDVLDYHTGVSLGFEDEHLLVNKLRGRELDWAGRRARVRLVPRVESLPRQSVFFAGRNDAEAGLRVRGEGAELGHRVGRRDDPARGHFPEADEELKLAGALQRAHVELNLNRAQSPEGRLVRPGVETVKEVF